ncbi:MAG: histidine phosphatase family protein [Pseudomonadota bacterium]
MPRPGAAELVMIRHAPAAHGGRLCGRTDVEAEIPADLSAWRAALPQGALITSPARRCVATAAALFPGQQAGADPRLWEQDFGVEDGRPFADLPDLGPLPRDALAARRPERGESFLDMVHRVTPALRELAGAARAQGPVAVVAHAGTVRAALGLALDDWPAALAFEVAPLSLTRLRCVENGMSIVSANWLPA